MNKFVSPEDIKTWWDALPDEKKTTPSGQSISLEFATGGIFVGEKGSHYPWVFFERDHYRMQALRDHLSELGLWEARRLNLVFLGKAIERLKSNSSSVEPQPAHGDDFIAVTHEASVEQVDAADELAEESASERQHTDDGSSGAARDPINAGKRQEAAWPKWLGIAAGVACIGLVTRLVRYRY